MHGEARIEFNRVKPPLVQRPADKYDDAIGRHNPCHGNVTLSIRAPELALRG